MDYVHGRSIIKIAIAEDNEMLQDLLPGFIDGMENCKVVIQAYNGRELLEKLSIKPDTSLILMDMKMPEMDGIEAAKKIKQLYPEMKILFMSVFLNELAYSRVISAGADGFIPIASPSADLKKAIFSVMKSGQYFHNSFPAIYRERPNGNGRPVKNKYAVTDEEIVFLKLICTDKTYEAIAYEMKTNLRHVDYVRQGLFERYEIHSRAELAVLAYNGGISS